MVVVFLILALLVSSPAIAQEASLIDILAAKGVITKQEAQRLKRGTKAQPGTPNQQALIDLLRKKGVLEDEDVAQLQSAPPTTIVEKPAATPPSREVTEWLSHLEKRQAELQAQNQAQVEELKKTTVADVKKSVDWLNRFSFFGDIRVRQEGFYQDHVDARNRQRLRLRFGARLTVSDELEGGLRLVSGDPNEITSNNQTLTDVFTRKPINIDNAYVTIKPSKSIGLEKAFFSITAGKFNVNFWRPRAVMASELVFDEDLTPEGFAQEITLFESASGLGNIKLAAGQWAVKEFFPGRDSYMLGEQLQVNFTPHPRLQLAVAGADYYFTRSDAIAQERNRNSALVLTNSVQLQNGQIVKGGDLIVPNTNNPIQRFAGGFHILDFSGQLNWDTGYAQWPFSLMVDYAQNLQAEFGRNDALLVGAGIGQTRNPGDWAVSALWERVETDSVISMFTLSDYGRRGGTNVKGPIAKIDYMLFPRLTLTAKGYFVNFIDKPSGQINSTVNRVQFDALFAF